MCITKGAFENYFMIRCLPILFFTRDEGISQDQRTVYETKDYKGEEINSSFYTKYFFFKAKKIFKKS